MEHIKTLQGMEKLERVESYMFALTYGPNPIMGSEVWDPVVVIRNSHRELRQQLADFIGAKLY